METDTGGESYDVLIVGAGFAGLCVAIKLQATSLRYCVLEQAATLGGTWRDNHYPGAACDIPSVLYCFSFVPNADWTRVYPEQAEIKAYMNRVADQTSIRPHMRFGARVDHAVFDAARGMWKVHVSDGKFLMARVLIGATGGLSRPKMPDIAGLQDFQGAVFHSARWHDRFDLKGKAIAVVGTGASAVQIVPRIIEQVGMLKLFQRTPAWIVPKDDRPLTAAECRRRRKWPLLLKLARLKTYIMLEMRALGFTRMPALLKAAQPMALKLLQQQVPDKSLRQRLTPAYIMGCKRILLANDFYPSLMRPQAQLITAPIVRATTRGLLTSDGVEHAVDAIIACTGFEAAEAGAPFPVIGLEGQELNTVWKEGAQAYLGTAVHGFPNLFLLVGPNTGLGHNSIIYMIESQVHYVCQALHQLGNDVWQVRADVQAGYNISLQARLARTVWNTGGCKSWYRTASGLNTTLWPDFTFAFRRATRRFDLSAYERVTIGAKPDSPAVLS
jgi:cation diffusion facilitator CzcD-associated flavoprotein CzcO